MNYKFEKLILLNEFTSKLYSLMNPKTEQQFEDVLKLIETYASSVVELENKFNK